MIEFFGKFAIVFSSVSPIVDSGRILVVLFEHLIDLKGVEKRGEMDIQNQEHENSWGMNKNSPLLLHLHPRSHSKPQSHQPPITHDIARRDTRTTSLSDLLTMSFT